LRLSHRPAKDSDIPLICAFPENAEELFYLFPKASFPLTPEQLAAAIAQRSDSTVVLLDGVVAGFANLYRWERGGLCSIGNVVVNPIARRRGVGRYLVETMVNIAFDKHEASEARISCFNGNVTGLLLYASQGFHPFEIEERGDRQGRRVALIHLRRPR
jgi:ribosomal protein S18 acetylase RimI-like enzyme